MAKDKDDASKKDGDKRQEGSPVSAEDFAKSERICKRCRRSIMDCPCPEGPLE